LDHERPGANDNASGCVTILEVARTLQKLIGDGTLPRPARTIRFVWPAEVEGTLALLNGKPKLVRHILAVVHMDMVGGNEATKSIFHVTRAPASLPTFINDIADAFGEFVNEQSYAFAANGTAEFPLVSPEGSKQALQAQFAEFTPGSDHDVYESTSYRIPAIYLNDWPDRYIHTNFDAPSNIDPTKLLRAAFIGAASGYFLASMSTADVPAAMRQVERGALRRAATTVRRRDELTRQGNSADAANLELFNNAFERAVANSIRGFAPITIAQDAEIMQFFNSLQSIVGRPALTNEPRDPKEILSPTGPNGPMSVFGYDYFTDHYGAERAKSLKLFDFEGLRGSGADYAYEILNFVSGKRTPRDIRNAVSAEYGPIPLEYVAEYLRALKSIGVVR
jgi:hypothetical protein